MPLPTFLLNRHDNDYSPLDIYNTASEESSLPTKTAHQTKKVFAKAKDKGIMRVFKFLINNEFIQSFSFIPIPVSAQDTRMKINAYCEKFDLRMNTEKDEEWLYITVSKPQNWSKRNIKDAAKRKKHSVPAPVSQKASKNTITSMNTLMEGLSTPLPEDNKGNLLLKKMGWEGGALGQNGSGIMEPVEIHIKRDNKGIGANSESQQPINTSMSFVRSSDR
ncbi:hypothetical protein AV274_3039 [Blastocystis sp. ATCC 50177/Nand II]|uniref:G-patch domain-containing protein n=1 Tax=Blastocystis sp. subtype 1 (strain ATCC 50177 / NandII) TaxID=478820 RepID=A0A196SDX7_BLAHN|nr:hypothetical protein AV274_3039 [Blastocystis sp. ATCC 50177/Nand II]